MTKLILLPPALALVAFTGCGDPQPDTAPFEVPAGGKTATGGTSAGAPVGAGRGGSAGSSVAPGSGGMSSPVGGSSGMPATAGGSAGSGQSASGGMPAVGGAAGGGTAGNAGSGTGGSGGVPNGMGGAPPMGGAPNAGSSGGGAAGTGPMTECTITATAKQSTAIPTVQTVTFTTTLTGVTSAQIEFGPAAGPFMVAPVDLAQAMYETYLVGMKPSASYVYRVKVTSPAGTCTSQDYPITTGALANAPKPTVNIMDAAKHDKGFIVLSSGLMGSSTYIIDPDGTTVWTAPTGSVPNSPSRAHLSWDARRMYILSLNVQNTGGKVQSVKMDGTDVQTVSGATTSHHDFTAIPGGIATVLWNSSGMDVPCSLVEFPEGGAQKTIIANISSVYNSNSFHTNAIHYYKRDDTYTMGDRNPNLFVKVSRTGSLIWQFGGTNPKDAAKNFSGVTTWSVNHGHHLTADGTFAFFNNGTGNNSVAFVYKLDETTLKATKVTQFTGTNSMVLGDMQVLPNGNFLITGSTSSTITEVTPEGTTVMKITGQQFGYAEFRESLYGEPPY